MKVARTILRGAALGNKCRLLDNVSNLIFWLTLVISSLASLISSFSVITIRLFCRASSPQTPLSFFSFSLTLSINCFNFPFSNAISVSNVDDSILLLLAAFVRASTLLFALNVLVRVAVNFLAHFVAQGLAC